MKKALPWNFGNLNQYVFSEGESLVLDKTVPDTITTWVATAISMHPTAGIAVTKQSTDVSWADNNFYFKVTKHCKSSKTLIYLFLSFGKRNQKV